MCCREKLHGSFSSNFASCSQKNFSENFMKIERSPVLVFFLIKLQPDTFSKKKTQKKIFPVNFAKFFIKVFYEVLSSNWLKNPFAKTHNFRLSVNSFFSKFILQLCSHILKHLSRSDEMFVYNVFL